MEVYRTRYPTPDWPDALELETLATNIEKTYGREFNELWRDDITLGELFAHLHQTTS